MPTIFSHAIAATALGHLFPERRLPLRFWLLTVICSVLPDADVIGFVFGIKYNQMLGHRGFSHSLLFAVVIGCLVANLAFRDITQKIKQACAEYLFFFCNSFARPVRCVDRWWSRSRVIYSF